jgi:formamidopyrimidine-DNA glycosylase
MASLSFDAFIGPCQTTPRMPELGEVEWFRKQWDPGIGAKILAVQMHEKKRLFRGLDTEVLRDELTGSRLLTSEARGKRMLFRFSGSNWLGIHLGMTGSLRVESHSFAAGKHDHLVLRQAKRSLILRDSRLFGQVRFHNGPDSPDWWNGGIPEIASSSFSYAFFNGFLQGHRRAPIKAVLLRQEGFSGIGNWMADEILWRAHLFPGRAAETLSEQERKTLWRETRFVARQSLKILGADDSHLPRNWLIHERWNSSGVCPKHRTPLRRATIGGRTTAWCPKCQPEPVRQKRRAMRSRKP